MSIISPKSGPGPRWQFRGKVPEVCGGKDFALSAKDWQLWPWYDGNFFIVRAIRDDRIFFS